MKYKSIEISSSLFARADDTYYIYAINVYMYTSLTKNVQELNGIAYVSRCENIVENESGRKEELSM